ncbi:hypothetical protein GGF32_005331 [Allomyces javanicus]|nr:hypothetical protein GGF32_005331 [Allomyces javanicus]
MDPQPECTICAEAFTEVLRRKVTCPRCHFTTCLACFKAHLLNSAHEPYCMQCRVELNDDFVIAVTTPTWRNGEYKRHRETILFDRERARLPETTALLQVFRDAQALYDEQYPVFTSTLEQRKNEIQALTQRLAQLHQQQQETHRQIEQLHQTMTVARNYVWRGVGDEQAVRAAMAAVRGDTSATVASEAQETERRTFTLPCPVNGCNGYLSQRYKCGVCDQYTCKECREVKNGEIDPDHRCNPDTVATVQLIRQDSRPCPQCFCMIFRISGCAQMWCTQCQVAFNWNTGRVDTGPVHNPHFFEYRRTVGGHERQQMLTLCGRRLDLTRLYHGLFTKSKVRHVYLCPPGLVRTKYPERTVTVFQNMYRLVVHIQQVHIPNIETRLHPWSLQAPRNDATRDIRLDYLLGKLSEDQAKRLLQRREKNRIKCHGYLAIYNMFCSTMEDILVRLANLAETPGMVRDADVLELFAEVESLRRYVNFQVFVHSKRMSSTAMHLYIANTFVARDMSTYGLAPTQCPTLPLVNAIGDVCDEGRFDEPRTQYYW